MEIINLTPHPVSAGSFDNPVLYARYEKTTDELIDSHVLNSKQKTSVRCNDVQLYYDKECTQKAGRYPWYYSNKPNKRMKKIRHNCHLYSLVWVE